MIGPDDVPSENPHETPPSITWSDADVPMELRGVSRQWVIEFVRSVAAQVNGPRNQAIQDAEYAVNHNKAGLWGMHDQPDLPIPEIPPYYFLTTHGLVNRVIKPLTASIKAPLYALVPDEFRGRPTTFISHTWSSLLLGPDEQRIGTLDALEECDAEFIWIDFVCYNQHTFVEIANDMLRMIQTIGSISVCATPTPIYSRCWCLWELVCTHLAGADVSLLVRKGYRNDKIIAVNTLYRSFKGIERAQATVPRDQEMIRNACISHYGSVELANKEIEHIIQERFSSNWHELQDKNERMKFSPAPWILGASSAEPAPYEPYYNPEMLDSSVFDSPRTVRELFADSSVYLGAAEVERLEALRSRAAWESTSIEVQEFFQCLFNDDAAGVKKYLKLGCDPESVMDTLTPMVIAARNGNVEILKMLMEAGARVDPANTKFSPLRLAADRGHHEVVQMLLRHGAAVDSYEGDEGWTALIWASAGGHVEIVKTLLEEGADVNHTVLGKMTKALHVAAQNGNTEVVRTLVAHGAEIDACEYRGLTALHLAAYHGYEEVVRILLDHGADRTIKGSRGETALELADEGRYQGVVRRLSGK